MRQNTLYVYMIAVFCALVAARDAQGLPTVRCIRVPDGGIQPQVVVGPSGRVHMIYFKGQKEGNIFYVSSVDGGKSFSKPIRVNSVEDSVIAAGSVRGAHIALGKNERVHVAWMGRHKETIGDREAAPMMYTRMNDQGSAFERERNVISQRIGLDGGGSVAADRDGNVYVIWHAPPEPGTGEPHRTIWVARSRDNGASFEPEQRAWDETTGACACCGMRAFADANGDLYVLYRSARQVVNRDMYLLVKPRDARSFRGVKVADWKVSTCVMSTASFTQSARGVLSAWETERQVYYATLSSQSPGAARVTAPAGTGKNRKHPALAANARGQVILVWTEDTAWAKGGSIAWQVFDDRDTPIEEARGTAKGLPVWGLAAAFADVEGNFVVVY
jgi:hypothetical protein